MFSLAHALVLGVLAGATAAAIALGRRAADPRPAERAVGWAYAAAWVTTYAWLLFPPLHEPAKTYPLQLCHLAALAAAAYLVTRRAWLRPLVHFWGLALCTQALVTPALVEGPALYAFWFFWATHGVVVGTALYDAIALGYRPGWRDWRFACGATLAYVAVVLPLDVAFGWNYGFVGPSRPEVRTIVDALGPWPGRLAWIALLAAGAMALLVLPRDFARRLAARRARVR